MNELILSDTLYSMLNGYFVIGFIVSLFLISAIFNGGNDGRR